MAKALDTQKGVSQWYGHVLNMMSIQGAIDLNIAGFVSLHGDFGFQTFVDVNGIQDIVIAAANIGVQLGTATTYLSIDQASLQLVVVPGSGYALMVNGGINELHGITGLSLSASGLLVKINTLGIDPTTLGIPTSLPTSDGSIALDFSGLGAGNIKDIPGSLFLNGSGSDTLNLDDSGSLLGRTGILAPTAINFTGLATITYQGIAAVTVSLSQGADSFTLLDTITSASATPVIVVNGNGGNDPFNIFDSHASTTITGGDGNDTFFVFANASTLNLNGNANSDGFNLFASVVAGQSTYQSESRVNMDGGTGTSDALNIFGTVLNDVIVIDGLGFTSLGLDVAFGNLTQWTVLGLGGDDTFQVRSVAMATTLTGDGSLPAFALPSGVSAPDLTGGATANSSNDTFYIGWRGVTVPGSLESIGASLTILGNQGTDAAYVDDSADTVDRGFTLTPTTLTSSAMGAGGQNRRGDDA